MRETCKKNFHSASHARFFKNDGISLDAAPNDFFDLVFTFDSLVHVEMGVLDSYIPQILRKLSAKGAAVVHHSNAAALPPREKFPHARSSSASAETVARAVCDAGGNVILQEIINWHGTEMIDCISVFCRQQRRLNDGPVRIWNPRFTAEVENIRTAQAPYSRI